jgi:DNA-binding PadR family transcriptional regulator
MTSDFKRQIVQRLTRDMLDLQLLRLISAEPTWGYRIKKSVEADLDIKLRHGALYPALNAMEQEGLVASKRHQQSGRSRKIYSLTSKGKEYLNAYYAVLTEQLKDKPGA